MMSRSKTRALLDEFGWNRDINRVRKLLLEGVDVNTRDGNDNTLLHNAAYAIPSFSIDKLKNELTAFGSSAQYPDESKVFEIIETRIRRGADIVDLLLKHGAPVDPKNRFECTPLHLAIDCDLSHVFLNLRENWPNIEWKESFMNLVLKAVDETAIRTAELLLSSGADMNARTSDGETPLYGPVISGFTSMVELLLKNGADANAQSNLTQYPLFVALPQNRPSISKLLLEHGANINAKDDSGMTLLHQAAWSLSPSIVKFLLEHGADVDARDKYENTPLYHAVSSREIMNISLLLEHGANINAKNDSGKTPLHEAVSLSSPSIAKFLLEHGADVDARDKYENTPLCYAVSSREIMNISLLLEHGANINAKNDLERTALYEAVSLSSPSIAKFLLEHGANVDAQNDIGITPLYKSILSGNIVFVQLLLEHGASANAITWFGKTPLQLLFDMSSLENFRDLFNLLLEYGADLEYKCDIEQTMAHKACAFAFECVVESKISHKLLLDIINEVFSRGVNVRAEDEFGDTPYGLVLWKMKNLSKRKLAKIRNSAFINHIKKLVALSLINMAKINRTLFFDLMNASIENQSNLEQKSKMDPLEGNGGDGHDYYDECVEEVEVLDTFQLSQNITLADVLTLGDPMKLATISQSIFFQKYTKSVDLDDKFPIYAFVLKHQYKRGLEMKLLRQKCEVSLRIISSGKLNRDCAQEVLQHLSEIELKCLSAAANQ